MTYKIKWRRSWFPLLYGFCPDPTEYAKEMRESELAAEYHSYPENVGCVTTYKDKNGAACAVLTLHPKLITEASERDLISILVHECIHIFEAIVDAMQEENPSEEFRAYSTQAIFDEILDDVMRYKEYLKKKSNI